MNLVINSRKMEVSGALKERIEKKLSKLDRYFDDDAHVNVSMIVEKERQIMEVTINYKGTIFRSQQSSDDMYKTLDETLEALDRQIRKNKTRLSKRLREGAFIQKDMPSAAAEEEESFQLIRKKKFSFKPMDVDEAILQMNLLGHSFYVFSDIVSHATCVVYKRKDGGYGLIEPE